MGCSRLENGYIFSLKRQNIAISPRDSNSGFIKKLAFAQLLTRNSIGSKIKPQIVDLDRIIFLEERIHKSSINVPNNTLHHQNLQRTKSPGQRKSNYIRQGEEDGTTYI